MRKPLFGELFVDNAGADRTVIHLYQSQPTPLEMKNLGTVFVLAEIDEPPAEFEAILDTIDSTLTSAYYRSSDFDVEAAFERALQRVNRAVQDLVSQFGESWTYKFNAVVGVIHNDMVHMSFVGSVEGFLVQGNSIIDVLQKDPSAEIKPLKLFSTLVSGRIGEMGADNASLVFATSSLMDFLSLEKIRRMVSGASATDAAAELEASLTESAHLANIAALIVQTTEQITATGATYKDGQAGGDLDTELDEIIERDSFAGINDGITDDLGNEGMNGRPDSMNRLIQQEHATGELLTPSIWPTLKKRFQTWANNRQTTQTGTTNYAKATSPAMQVLKTVWEVLKNVAMQIVLGIAWLTKQIVTLIQNNQSIRNGMQTGVRGAQGWFSSLTTPRKVFLGVAVVFIVFFLFSVVLRDRSNNQAEAEDGYQSTLSQVENALGEVQSKQILNDEAGVRTAIQRAKDLLASVPTDSDAYEEKGAGLAGQITDLENQYNKVEVKNDYTSVGDFGSALNGAQVRTVTLIGDNMYAFTDKGSVIRLQLNGSASEVVAATNTGVSSAENDSAATTLVANDDKTIDQFNPVLEENSEVPIELADNLGAVTDMDVFGTRLYILDGQNKTIYRHEKSGDSYGESEQWLNNGIDLGNAVSFDIDGSIYVLGSDGAIRKFDGGSQSSFTVDSFSPSLDGAKSLVKTSATGPFVVMNPATQRLVVLTSEGGLDKQLTSSQFNDLKAMAYDEDNNTIYVVSGTQVFQVGL